MAKGKILKEQKLSLNNIPKRKLKTKALTISSARRLSDKNFIFEALWECLITEDLDSFKEILKSHIDAIGMTELSKTARTSKRTMYRTLSADGNPTLKSISKILNALWG
jgi:probable addiction module antidote protein